MNTNSSQSQPSQYQHEEEKPPVERVRDLALQINGTETAMAAHHELMQYLKKAEENQFEFGLRILLIFFKKGYSNLFLTQTDLMRKMMNHFTKLAKELQGQNSAHSEAKMLFVLSIIAELIKEQPKFYFPFTRKFLINVFSIDFELLENCPEKDKILAILAVIYNNLSRQGRLLRKLNVQKQLKNALLTNFSLISEIFTLRLFNRAVLNMAQKGVSFSSAELAKHSVLETISGFINKNQVQLFLVKVKATLFADNAKRQVDPGQNQEKMIAE